MKAETNACRGRARRPAVRVVCALAIAALSGTVHAAYECANLTAVTTADATMTVATAVTPPTTIGGAVVSVPMCRVQGVARPSADSEIKFEVWLPPTAADWSGRMKVNGTGGYAGSIPYARLAQDIGDGFVTAGSNMGHDGGESASWTLNHPEKVKDWGLRAHYSVATAAKALSSAFYDKPVKLLVLRGLLERWPPGDDDGAELSRALRRHRGRGAVELLPGPADVAAVDRQAPDTDGGVRAAVRQYRRQAAGGDGARAADLRRDGRPRRRPDHEPAPVPLRHRHDGSQRRRHAHGRRGDGVQGHVRGHDEFGAACSATPARGLGPRPTGARCSPTTAATVPSSATTCIRSRARHSIGAGTSTSTVSTTT